MSEIFNVNNNLKENTLFDKIVLPEQQSLNDILEQAQMKQEIIDKLNSPLIKKNSTKNWNQK